MKDYAATRTLLISEKGKEVRSQLTIKIGIPYVVKQDQVNFEVDGETSACEVEINGLNEAFREITYGADLLQALQLSADVDPLLKRFSNIYDFYFKTGEPYFD